MFMCLFNLSQSRFESLFNLFLVSSYNDGIEDVESKRVPPTRQIVTIGVRDHGVCSSLMMMQDLAINDRLSFVLL